MVLIPCLRNSKLTSRGGILLAEYMEALSDAGYCLIPRDRECARNILRDYDETLKELILAAEQVKDPEGELGAKGNSRVTLRDLHIAGHLRDGDEFELIVGSKSGDKIVFKASSEGFAVDEDVYSTPSAAVKALLGEHVTYNGWSCFKRVSDGSDLFKLRERYQQEEGARIDQEKIDSFSDEACNYANAVLQNRMTEFELLEKAIKDVDDSGFALPEKYTAKSWTNFDYSFLKQSLDLDEAGGVPAYFKGREGKKSELGSVSLDRKPYRISYSEKDMSALDATRKAAKETDQINKSNSYRWAQYWYVTAQTSRGCTKFNDQTFIQVYEQLQKKQNG